MRLALLVPAFVLAGCAGPTASGPQFAHVHGLAYDAGSGALFVATHNGLLRGGLDDDGAWSWAYVGEKRYDLMGFSQDGATGTTFYAGGHPGLLGLAKSTDAGITWTSQSYEGQADIHALTGIPGQADSLVAWWNGMPLVLSRDGGKTWTPMAAPPQGVLALAATRQALLVGSSAGLQTSSDWGKTLQAAAAPAPGAVTALGASHDGSVLYASVSGPGGSIHAYRSLDRATTWSPLQSGGLQGAAYSVVFAVDPQDAAHAFAATYAGHVEETRDGGATWTVVRA